MDNTEKSYLKCLQDIMNNSQTNEKKIKNLEVFEKIKPVRLLYYLDKATLVFGKKGGVAVAYNLLGGKYCDYYAYEGICDTLKFLGTLDMMHNDTVMCQYRNYVTAQLQGNESDINQMRKQLQVEEEKNLVDVDYNLTGLMHLYFISGKWVNLFVAMRRKEYKEDIAFDKGERIGNRLNMGYLKEWIALKKNAIICIDSIDMQNEAYILGRCLATMDCPAYVLSVPEKIDVDAPLAVADTVSVSMENASELYGFTLIPTVELICQGRSLGNNSANIIDAICGKDETVLVLASSRRFEELSYSPLLKNRIENLSGYQETFRTSYYAFGWCGSYLDYISQLYDMDAKEAVYRKPECKFSIVIPVRNSAATLQYTLKTCLDQRYQGDYEIVVSDNSTDGNSEVWQYCQSLKDDRVRYYKTPRNLNLSRSFEYAFLQSRGEFVFSIGADDAVLPWTLEVLEQIREKYPEEEVILWDRGFYAWPGFNKGQENEFHIPKRYIKGEYQEKYVEPIQGLAEAIRNPQAMYGLPMLYINSGFKRSFLQTLLRDTGRLWDGICQDIYMGTIVSVIKKHILYLAYPLAIAGMSSGSIGALSTLPMESQQKGNAYTNRIIQENNIGGFSKSRMETLAPELGSDVSSLYNCVLRAVNRGLIPVGYLKEVFDWKEWFTNIYKVLSKKDVYFDRKIHQMRFAAMKHGEEFLKWFDENIYKDALTPVIFNETECKVKTYKEEEGDRIVTDASKYGVYNVYEASKLFERLAGL